MKIAIIGPPQSGKTTLFKILLGKDISGNIGVFKTLDPRLEKISEAFSSRKKTYPEFSFVDLGAISNFKRKDLSELQDIDLFLCIAAEFLTEDPRKDFESSLTDIILFDLEIVQDRLKRLEKEGKKTELQQECRVLEKCQSGLSEGNLLYKTDLTRDEVKLLSGLVLLSLKPLIGIVNISEEEQDALEKKIRPLEEYCRKKDMRCLRCFAKTELELMELEAEEREKFIKELGPAYNFKEDLAKAIPEELDLITFFTANEKETRGWYLKSGLSVIEAAGKIHSDMERGFIRAEVVNFEDFMKCGSVHKAREQGVLKVEGKDYIVRDGDIINIRFNV